MSFKDRIKGLGSKVTDAAKTGFDKASEVGKAGFDKASEAARNIDTDKIKSNISAGVDKASQVAKDLSDKAAEKAGDVKMKTVNMVKSEPLTLERAKEDLSKDLELALSVFDAIPVKPGFNTGEIQASVVSLAMNSLVDCFDEEAQQQEQYVNEE